MSVTKLKSILKIIIIVVVMYHLLNMNNHHHIMIVNMYYPCKLQLLYSIKRTYYNKEMMIIIDRKLSIYLSM